LQLSTPYTDKIRHLIACDKSEIEKQVKDFVVLSSPFKTCYNFYKRAVEIAKENDWNIGAIVKKIGKNESFENDRAIERVLMYYLPSGVSDGWKCQWVYSERDIYMLVSSGKMTTKILIRVSLRNKWLSQIGNWDTITGAMLSCENKWVVDETLNYK
jgi:hypothetical protein